MLATLGILLLVLLLVFAAFIEEAIRPLQTLANVVAALREEDYSFRARGANREDSLGQLSLEINALADTLQAQRVGALEAVALLRRVIAEMDAPVLAFDQDARLRLLNPAAERAFALQPARDLGKSADELDARRPSRSAQRSQPAQLEAHPRQSRAATAARRPEPIRSLDDPPLHLPPARRPAHPRRPLRRQRRPPRRRTPRVASTHPRHRPRNLQLPHAH